MHDAFFRQNFLIARGILVQKIITRGAIFCQSYDVKNGGRSQQPSVLGQLVTAEPQRSGISRPKES